jgi:hypothetical protein
MDYRLAALWRFALSITGLNLLGHAFLGFEQSWAQPLVALVTSYSVTILLELVDARATRRPTRFSGGPRNVASVLLPAHISGLAVAMLLYANDRLWPIAFAAAAAAASKAIFRVSVGKGSRHFFNPSNFGITLTLLLFAWVGIAPPYHFTENVSGAGDWILPGLIVISGTFLNSRLTKKMPLILAWLVAFAAQAFTRSAVFETPVTAALVPMTGIAFVLFTFYMISDPGTTPFDTRGQVVFGVAVAVVYALLVTVHVVFGLFFALTIVSALRGVGLFVQSRAARRARPTATIKQAPALLRRSEL